eukprot:TRINITY_DN1888_c0_g1_i1.p1 TRINITY_DN1888_c0_g1~~TRINITY_DN1888_c0_g1_i1.p1  ORF type:complete len:102 (+),score=32.17 TRINITY_DN1888_c0_g1_i1:74-379(+)
MSNVIKRLIPLADRVLIRRVKPAEKIGAIYLPESSQKNPLNEGQVIAVGPGARSKDGSLITPSVKVGDFVVLGEYGGQEVKINSESLHLYHESDILGIIEK